MAAREILETSLALQRNLDETRSNVVIPDEYKILLRAVDDYFGVHEATQKVLTEYFHPFRNLGGVVADLAALCERRFSYFEKSDERAVCAEKFAKLFHSLKGDFDEEAFSRLFRALLEFLQSLAKSTYLSEYETALRVLIADIKDRLDAGSARLYQSFNFMRSVGRRLSSEGELGSEFLEIYSHFLTKEMTHLSNQLPDEESRAEIKAALQKAKDSPDDQIYTLPTIDEIISSLLLTISKEQNLRKRVDCFIHLAALPNLAYRSRDIVENLNNAIDTLFEHEDLGLLSSAVSTLATYIKECPPSQKLPLLICLERVGKKLAQPCYQSIREKFIEDMIETGFEGPDIGGVSDEWQVLVNPHHLPNIRSWLSIVESGPTQYERLLSALIVNLHFRGIFVCDTDLFQRDMTKLLNTDVSRVFNLVTQLVSFFPVFYNEIGSEGDLRDVSTRLDQLTNRQDELTHFLRKQCHAESNNTLIGFSKAVLAYWMTGKNAPLAPYLPKALLDTLPQTALAWYEGAHKTTRHLTHEKKITIDELAGEFPLDEMAKMLDEYSGASSEEKERVLLLVRLHRLLVSKYSYGPEELVEAILRSAAIDEAVGNRFISALRDEDSWKVLFEGNRVLSQLKRVITSHEVTEPLEDIYFKRHIAVGIPSMYGTYREPKFDAMGLLFRVVNVMTPHLESVVAAFESRYMTKTSLLLAYRLMRTIVEGLSISGLHVEDLTNKVELLKRSLWVGNFSATQFLNVIEFIANALDRVIETNYIDVHEKNLQTITRAILMEQGHDSSNLDERASAMAEAFLRKIIASTFGLQSLDLFIDKIRRSLMDMTKNLSEDQCTTLLNFSQDKLVSFIDEPVADNEDQLILGSKGLTLKRLHGLSLPVPQGFIVSTELFNLSSVMEFPQLRSDTCQRIREAVTSLEDKTHLSLGSPTRPLIVSVRSGAAVSMPGMMDTVINVGLTRDTTEEWAETLDNGWTAWDCYRRFVQSYAMSKGLPRDLFDELIGKFKEKHHIERKLDFTKAQMRQLALQYEEAANERGCTIVQDPFEQIMNSIFSVIASWDSDTARAYRKEMKLSDGWGTAVIVQRMVLGNLGKTSGTGALFTTSPRTSSTGVELFGDFTMCSQGEDVVSGLVHPFPISERQRQEYAQGVELSLETKYPAIYERLRELANNLVHERGFEHQEMEFTFENDSPEALFILQSRPMVGGRFYERATFVASERLQKSFLAEGVGVAGGALSGRAAFTENDIDLLRQEDGGPIILLRPDTVPEDIPLVMAADGLLTARGGMTSHASVSTKRMNKPCVVNCQNLEISTDNDCASFGEQTLKRGDLISIDGTTGAVYAGVHEIKRVKRTIRLL